MSEEELKQRVDRVKDYVILSNARINYQLQLIDLVRSKNRIVMVHQGFYAMVNRDFNRSLLLDLRALTENKTNTHNLRTLTGALRSWTAENRNANTSSQMNLLCESIDQLLLESIVQRATVLSSTQAAHRALRLPTQQQNFTYQEASEWLKKVGDVLNQISGLLWSSGTVMSIYDSDGDSFKRELEHMERAELAGSHLLRIDDSHEAVAYADRMLASRNGRINYQ